MTGWPIEVWNEPNLPGFWKDADMEEYFLLFAETFAAVKEVDSRFRVGGPAICGVEDEKWIRCFLEFCSRERIPLDFVTRHHYTTEVPETAGHYGYVKLREPEEGFENLQSTRDIVDSFTQYRGWRFILRNSTRLMSPTVRCMIPTRMQLISRTSFPDSVM